jgi:hypothetical protein
MFGIIPSARFHYMTQASCFGSTEMQWNHFNFANWWKPVIAVVSGLRGEARRGVKSERTAIPLIGPGEVDNVICPFQGDTFTLVERDISTLG